MNEPSQDTLTVPIEVLKSAFAVLIQHVESQRGESVELDADYFWSIPRDELYDVDNVPADLTIGQLSETLENLQKIAENPSETIAFGIVWLGDPACTPG